MFLPGHDVLSSDRFLVCQLFLLLFLFHFEEGNEDINIENAKRTNVPLSSQSLLWSATSPESLANLVISRGGKSSQRNSLSSSSLLMTRRTREDRLGFVGDMQEKTDVIHAIIDNIDGTKIINSSDLDNNGDKINEEKK